MIAITQVRAAGAAVAEAGLAIAVPSPVGDRMRGELGGAGPEVALAARAAWRDRRWRRTYQPLSTTTNAASNANISGCRCWKSLAMMFPTPEAMVVATVAARMNNWVVKPSGFLSPGSPVLPAMSGVAPETRCVAARLPQVITEPTLCRM
jgi:hypothetical protein